MIDLTKEIQDYRSGKKARDIDKECLRVYHDAFDVLHLLGTGQLEQEGVLSKTFSSLLADFVPFLAEAFPSISFEEDDVPLLGNTAESNILSSLLAFRRYERSGFKDILSLLDSYKRLLCAEKNLNKA